GFCQLSYSCGPSTRFFFVKSRGFSIINFPLQTSHNWAAKINDEYIPAIRPIAIANAKVKMEEAPNTKNATTAISVVIVVFNVLVKDWTMLRLIISARTLKDLTRLW